MSATITETELRSLGDHLEMLLRERNIPVGIRCAYEQERLIIVGCHQPDVTLEPVQVLRALQSLVASFRLAFTRRVRLYLRVMGRSLPYARCHFLMDDFPLLVAHPEDSEPVQITAWLEGMVTDLVASDGADASVRGALLAPEIHAVPWEAIRPQMSWRWPGGVENYLAATAMFGMALSGYLVSQPCISGTTCPELQTAQALGQESQQILNQAQNSEDLQEAQEYLIGAVGLLETIPRWSERSPDAQALAATYRQQMALVEQAIAAADLATSAQEKSNNVIHQLESWATIQLLWQEAIAKLEAIPADGPLAEFAARMQENYRSQLAFAREQRSLEESGQEELYMARQEIQQAQNKHAKAVTVTDWQTVWTIWDSAINRLQGISPQTQAGVEAQRLLAAYGKIPQELGDRLQLGIVETPELPPEPTYQTPIQWADLNQEIDIPPPPLVLR